jgi:hypothetical protein
LISRSKRSHKPSNSSTDSGREQESLGQKG